MLGMCLAIPGKIISKEGDLARVDFGGVIREVSLKITPEAREGDYVIVHTGYAISVLDEKEALETLKVLEELSQYIEE